MPAISSPRTCSAGGPHRWQPPAKQSLRQLSGRHRRPEPNPLHTARRGSEQPSPAIAPIRGRQQKGKCPTAQRRPPPHPPHTQRRAAPSGQAGPWPRRRERAARQITSTATASQVSVSSDPPSSHSESSSCHEHRGQPPTKRGSQLALIIIFSGIVPGAWDPSPAPANTRRAAIGRTGSRRCRKRRRTRPRPAALQIAKNRECSGLGSTPRRRA